MLLKPLDLGLSVKPKLMNTPALRLMSPCWEQTTTYLKSNKEKVWTVFVAEDNIDTKIKANKNKHHSRKHFLKYS